MYIYWPLACGPLHHAGLGWENLHLLATAAMRTDPPGNYIKEA